ncbi:MAG TPA: hypothetical protein VIQ30_02660 [Pseudonocardia sp.]
MLFEWVVSHELTGRALDLRLHVAHSGRDVTVNSPAQTLHEVRVDPATVQLVGRLRCNGSQSA